jgi:hypothetical protein
VPWSRIPWRLLVDHAPTIVDAARRLYVGSRAPHGASGPRPDAAAGAESLQRAVEQLEAREAQHAELLAELAKHVRELTTAVETLRACVWWAWAGIALAVALTMVSALLLRR